MLQGLLGKGTAPALFGASLDPSDLVPREEDCSCSSQQMRIRGATLQYRSDVGRGKARGYCNMNVPGPRRGSIFATLLT
jgi:hypothetical protein